MEPFHRIAIVKECSFWTCCERKIIACAEDKRSSLLNSADESDDVDDNCNMYERKGESYNFHGDSSRENRPAYWFENRQSDRPA
jgi:hypothetical protein